jgi:addiction module HigA family antidote
MRRLAKVRLAIHPGEILADELTEIGISATELARQLAVPPNRITQIVQGKRSITGDTALRLAHWFGTNPQFWLNLQASYELDVAIARTGAEIRKLPTKAGVAA